MSKILIITGQFVPYTKSLGGILRVYSFLRSLQKKHKLFLLSSKSDTKNYGYLGLKKKDLKGIDIKYIKNDNLKLFSAFFNFKLFRNFFYLLGVDYTFSINTKYLNQCFEIINKNNIEYLIISSPPFSLFYLVKKIRKRFKNIKIILDYRDGWSTRINNLINLPLKLIIQIFIEKKILEQSNFVTTATSNINSKLNHLIKNKSILIRNGFIEKPKKKNKQIKKNNKIKIGYFGLISEDSSSYRNIRIIFNKINDNEFLKKKLIFEFYGNNDIKSESIKNLKSFKFKKNLSYKKAISKMAEMDYLLILHTEKSTSEEMVTSKFYDYLASGTPIINVSSGENEVGQIIKRLKLGYNIDYEKQSLEKFLNELKKNNKKIRWNKYFDTFSRNYQNKKLLKLIK